MSLKAKIEAVIYASEEPVTLAQLTGLLGEEGQAELDALAAQQHSLALEDEEALDSSVEGGADSTVEPILDPEALNAETIVPTDVPTETEPGSEAEEPVAGAAGSEQGAPRAGVSLSKGLDSEGREVQPGSSVEPGAAELAEKKLARDAAAQTKLRERRLRDYFRSLLEELIADYANGDRGLEIREVAGGFRLGTKPEYHDAVRGFVKSLKPPLKLTLQALETLAVVAYKQPVTAPEVSEIRGVDSAGVLGSLLTRKLVTTAGRKQVIGRPILYKTTKDFLLRFGLKDINELPSIEEFEKMAGELNDAVQEEIPMEPGAGQTAASEEAGADPVELEGHNLQPVEGPAAAESEENPEPDAPTSEPDAPTSEPESIPESESVPEPESVPESESISQADAYPGADTPDDPEA